MEKRLEQALDYSNFRLVLATRQENLKVLLKNRLIISYNGGFFDVNINLISFLNALIDAGEMEFVFIDKNDVPILVDDLPKFLSECLERYKDAIYKYHSGYEKLQQARDIRKVLDWDGTEE
jgi:hypothetical protein